MRKRTTNGLRTNRTRKKKTYNISRGGIRL